MAEPIKDPYLVWTNYGSEGWSYRKAETLDEALAVREEQLSLGNDQVIITKLVKTVTAEVEEG